MRDIPKQVSELNSKYSLFRKQLGTFVDSLLYFLKQESPVMKPIRTVEQVDSLVVKYGYMNLTFNTTTKLWLQIYDDLRCLVRDEIDAAQDASKEISDETLKIRVTEALEYVNEVTQPTCDVVDIELDRKLQQPHDELFQLSFTERKILGPIVALMPVALDALTHATKLTLAVCGIAQSAISHREKEEAESLASSRASASKAKKPWRPAGRTTPLSRKSSSVM